MGRKTEGTSYVKADDQQFTLKGSVSFPLSTTIREPIESSSPSQGFYRETDIAPYVKASTVFDPNIDWDKIKTATNLTVTAEAANGMVYVLTEAYVSGEIEINVEEGTVELVFHGAVGVLQ